MATTVTNDDLLLVTEPFEMDTQSGRQRILTTDLQMLVHEHLLPPVEEGPL